MNLSTLRKVVAALLAIGGVAITVSVNITVDVGAPPVDVDSLGWAGPEKVEDAQEYVSSLPPFEIANQTRDNKPRRVCLWDYAKKVNNGKHIPTYRQQVGDCVSFGTKNAVEYHQAFSLFIDFAIIDNPELEPISARGPPHPANAFEPKEWRPVYAPYVYGTSRVQVGGGRLRGDGSIGAWAAKAVQEYGILASDAPGVPPYSGKVAREWGKSGPPEEFLLVGRKFPVKTVSKVKTAEEAMNALCNGYPVTIASNAGFGKFETIDGVHVGVWNTRWMHQMCLIGYDGSKTLPKFYCLNSWGSSAHKPPLQGEPPGGFWIRWSDVNKITAQGDSFAYSGFEGFPSVDVPDPEDIDFTIVGSFGPAQSTDTSAMKDDTMNELLAIANKAQLTFLGLGMIALAVLIYYLGRLTPRKFGGSCACLLLLVFGAVAAHGQEINFQIIEAGPPAVNIEENLLDFTMVTSPATRDIPSIVQVPVQPEEVEEVRPEVPFEGFTPQNELLRNVDLHKKKVDGELRAVFNPRTDKWATDHLISDHGLSAEQLKGLTLEQKEWVHSAVHVGDASPLRTANLEKVYPLISVVLEGLGEEKTASQPHVQKFKWERFCRNGKCYTRLVPAN